MWRSYFQLIWVTPLAYDDLFTGNSYLTMLYTLLSEPHEMYADKCVDKDVNIN